MADVAQQSHNAIPQHTPGPQLLASHAHVEDEATAVETKRAADVAAERLPSLNPQAADGTRPANPDGTPAGPAAVDPKNQPTTVPHPLPALHPDKYTPGETPPASSLRPGAPHSNPATSNPATLNPDDSEPADDAGSKPARPKKPATTSSDPNSPTTSNPPVAAPKEHRR